MARLTRLIQDLKARCRRYAMIAVVLATGIGMGTAVGLTTVSMIDRAAGEPHGRPVAPPLPDYAATIRAPTPTPSPDQGPQENVDVPLYREDIAAFRDYTWANVWLDAVNISAQGDNVTLLHLLTPPPEIAQCYEEKKAELDNLPLLPTLRIHTQDLALGCVMPLLSPTPAENSAYAQAGPARRQQAISNFLTTYAQGRSPTAGMTAAVPSPSNVALWRATRVSNAHCIHDISRQAENVARLDDPEAAALAVRNAAQEIHDCQTRTHRQLLAQPRKGRRSDQVG